MWSPADKSALPTPEELKKAKETMNLVQRDLETAMVVLAQAQLRVEILKKDLEERNAWIAPVRKLPFDVLSMIFDWCGDIEWDSPAQVAAVCRTWRRVVIDTPRAWSFVDLAFEMTDEGITMFLERSRERPLHVYLPDSRVFDLSSVAHRIHCLSLDDIESPPQTLVFANLQRLTVFRRASTIPIDEITTHRFPALRHLVTVSVPLYHNKVDNDISFPQLETWSLCVSQTSAAWLDGLHSCQNTLVSLTLNCLPNSHTDEQPLIQLPVLRCLEIMTQEVLRKESFNLKTPMLETYEEFTGNQALFEAPIHTDVSTVSEMRFLTMGALTLSLSYCPGLKMLQIESGDSSTITSVLDQLSVDEQVCPVLRSIELLMADLDVDIASHSARLLEINLGRSLPIEITTSENWNVLRGHIPVSVGLYPRTPPFINLICQCGNDMPCVEGF